MSDDATPLDGASLNADDDAFLDQVLGAATVAAPPVPSAVAERWDAAIAAELAARAAGTAPGTTPVDVDAAALAEPVISGSGSTVVPMGQRSGHGKPKRRGFALAGVAASVAAVALVGGVVANQIASTDTPATITAEGGGGAGSTPAPLPTASVVTYSGATYTASQVSQQVSTLISAPPAAYAATPQPVEGDTLAASPIDPDGEADTTDSGTGLVLPKTSDGGEEPTTSQQSADVRATAAINTLATDPAARADCIAYLAQAPGVSPAAIDVGTFEGGPALMVVLPTLGTPGKVDVYIIGATCTATDADVKYFTRIDIPRN